MFTESHLPVYPQSCKAVKRCCQVIKTLAPAGVSLSPNQKQTFSKCAPVMSLKSSHPEIQSKPKEFVLCSVYSENMQLSILIYSAQGPCLLKQT